MQKNTASTTLYTLSLHDALPISEEVLGLEFQGERVAPKNAKARNIAFDVTPNRLVTGIVTENGVIYPPYEINLRQAVDRKSTRLNSSHLVISYAVFCLKKKNNSL